MTDATNYCPRCEVLAKRVAELEAVLQTVSTKAAKMGKHRSHLEDLELDIAIAIDCALAQDGGRDGVLL